MIAGQPAGEDPDGLVRVCDGEIHMYRDTPEGTTVPFGVIPHEEELREIGKLAACSGDFPDAHQALLPPLEQDVARIEFAPGNAPFGFYMEGHATSRSPIPPVRARRRSRGPPGFTRSVVFRGK